MATDYGRGESGISCKTAHAVWNYLMYHETEGRPFHAAGAYWHETHYYVQGRDYRSSRTYMEITRVGRPGLMISVVTLPAG